MRLPSLSYKAERSEVDQRFPLYIKWRKHDKTGDGKPLLILSKPELFPYSILPLYRIPQEWAFDSCYFCSVQSLSRVRLSATPWIAARQASLPTTNSQSSPKPMFIESVMPPNHLILCCPLLLLPSIFPSIRVFPNESALRIKWPKYWSFSISPSDEYSGLISFRMDWYSLN